jgi:uncharacterized membrane protein SpoIIM required for sporulation
MPPGYRWPPRTLSGVDLDAFVAVHGPEWNRLEELTARRRLSGAEADELVTLYQRAATHLSVVRSSAPDPAVIARLSTTVARARSVVSGTAEPWNRELARFVVVSFPAAVYRIRWWVTACAAFTVVVATAFGAWVANDPRARAAIGSDAEIRQLVEHDFENYYSEFAAGSFAARVWTNNAWVAATCIAFGVTGVFILWVLWQNAVNVGGSAGLMAAYGRLDLFFGLITPHGLLELTAVFVAAGAGLRLFWSWVDPGPLPRLRSMAREGRAMVTVALGLVVVLLVSGVLEAFVTPSPLPTWARIAIGVLAWGAFVGYVGWFGRRAVRAGETGDLTRELRGDEAPVAG